MKVLNIHQRTINQSRVKVLEIVRTLATKNDKVWPKAYWPKMYLDNGLQVGSKGGHGFIKYSVTATENYNVEFTFSNPKGFIGFHGFYINETSEGLTNITHVIDMKTKGLDTFMWIFVIRWLHDALIEDALDKIENQFSKEKSKGNWNPWVRILRFIIKLKL